MLNKQLHNNLMIRYFFLTISIIQILTISAVPAKADFAVPSVEASVDHGLFLEIVLNCKEVLSGNRSSSIMSFYKAENKYCSAQNICFESARQAAIQSCNKSALSSSNHSDE